MNELLLDPLYILNPDPSDAAPDQTWFHLGEANYLIQTGEPSNDTPDIVINVVGIAETDGKDPYVLLLG